MTTRLTTARQAVVLRPVTDTGAHALTEVFRQVHGEQFVSAGVPEPVVASLLELQFRAQQTQYRASHPQAGDHLIEVDGRTVGRCYVERTGTVFRVLDIAVVPDRRRQGIAGTVLADLLREASEHAACVHLNVWTDNEPARRLYAHLGFRLRAEWPDGSLELCRPPAASGGRCPADHAPSPSSRKGGTP